jgi:hypothetical protein
MSQRIPDDGSEAPIESLWTANDVAAYLKVSRSWVDRLRFFHDEERARAESEGGDGVSGAAWSHGGPAASEGAFGRPWLDREGPENSQQ